MDARSHIPNLPNIGIRQNLNVEEQSQYQSQSQYVYNLNREARDNGGAVSYSLRDDENLSIWKFIKQEDGTWRRDRTWNDSTLPKNAQTSNQGNIN